MTNMLAGRQIDLLDEFQMQWNVCGMGSSRISKAYRIC